MQKKRNIQLATIFKKEKYIHSNILLKITI